MRKFKYRSLFILAIVIALSIIAGCGNQKQQMDTADSAENKITVIDDLNRSVFIDKYPKKIVALSPSFLEILSEVDAELIGRPSSKSNVPENFKAIEEIGAVYQINIEKVVGLQPDLVIAYEGMHNKFIPILESNHIPVIVLKMKTYEDVIDKIQLLGKVVGNEAKGQALVEKMQKEVKNIVDKVPKESKRVAILHSTAKSVTVELDSSIAGSTAKMLGFKNVATGSKALESDPDSTPYSLEKLVESNPEVIFVVTMGELEAIKKRMLEDVESNPAWNSLEAVKNKKIYFLPQELFLLNPSIHYPEAVHRMAKLVYPEVFMNGE